MRDHRRIALGALACALACASPACSGSDESALDPADVPELPHAAEDDDGALPDAPDVEDAGPTEEGDAGGDAGAPPPASCAVAPASKAAYLRYGLHPRASDAFQRLKVTSARITQTIGSAAASAGTHAQDGTAEGKPYTTAVDLSVRGMTDAQVAVFLDALTEAGFVPFFRKPGSDGWPASEARHIHAIWVGAPMKLSLRNQVRDWRVGKNGLASHTTYEFKTWTQCWRDALWAEFLKTNPATN